MNFSRVIVAAATALALAAGALVAVPVAATAAAAPKLLSVSASPRSVTTVPALNKARKVTVTAVYSDPDNVIKKVAFSSPKPLPAGYSTNQQDYSAVKSGANRTFSYTLDIDYNHDPGVTRAYVVAQAEYTTQIAGTTGSTSFVVKNKPLMSLSGTRSNSYIWGTRARFYGQLTSTPANAHKKIEIQFNQRGKQRGKKWKKRQTLRTNAEGTFHTKKFKINKPGRWRALYRGSTYVERATGSVKVYNPYG